MAVYVYQGYGGMDGIPCAPSPCGWKSLPCGRGLSPAAFVGTADPGGCAQKPGLPHQPCGLGGGGPLADAGGSGWTPRRLWGLDGPRGLGSLDARSYDGWGHLDGVPVVTPRVDAGVTLSMQPLKVQRKPVTPSVLRAVPRHSVRRRKIRAHPFGVCPFVGCGV